MSEKIFSFEPVITEDCRALVLGSMPSVKSLEASFYYAHPRNAFWPILADIFSVPLPNTAAERKQLALRHGIALWDVAHSCTRAGSLDTAMREVELNDFHTFFARHWHIERILLNGGTARKLYGRLPNELTSARCCIQLPSTSPAYTLPYARKLEAWRAAILFTSPHP